MKQGIFRQTGHSRLLLNRFPRTVFAHFSQILQKSRFWPQKVQFLPPVDQTPKSTKTPILAPKSRFSRTNTDIFIAENQKFMAHGLNVWHLMNQMCSLKVSCAPSLTFFPRGCWMSHWVVPNELLIQQTISETTGRLLTFKMLVCNRALGWAETYGSYYPINKPYTVTSESNRPCAHCIFLRARWM